MIDKNKDIDIDIENRNELILSRLEYLCKTEISKILDRIFVRYDKKLKWYTPYFIKLIDVELVKEMHNMLLEILHIISIFSASIDVYDQDLIYFSEKLKDRIKELITFTNLSGKTLSSEGQLRQKLFSFQVALTKYLGICKMLIRNEKPRIYHIRIFIDTVLENIKREAIEKKNSVIRRKLVNSEDYWFFKDRELSIKFYVSMLEVIDILMQYYVFIRNLPFKSLFEITTSDMLTSRKTRKKTNRTKGKYKTSKIEDEENDEEDDVNEEDANNDKDESEYDMIEKNKKLILSELKTKIMDSIGGIIQNLIKMSMDIDRYGYTTRTPGDLLYECESMIVRLNEFLGLSEYFTDANFVKSNYCLEDIVEIYADKKCAVCRKLFNTILWDYIKDMIQTLGFKIKIYDSNNSDVALNRRIGIYEILHVPTIKWKYKTFWVNPAEERNRDDLEAYKIVVRELEMFFDVVGEVKQRKESKKKKTEYKNPYSKDKKRKIHPATLKRLMNEYRVLSLFENDPNKEVPKYKLKEALRGFVSDSTINTIIKRLRENGKIVISRTTEEGVILYKLGYVDMSEYEPVFIYKEAKKR